MKKLASILRLDFLPLSVDAGLLVLRLWYGIGILGLHGWDKLSKFQQMSHGFPDPLNIGHRNSLALVVFAEVLCAVFLAIGFWTRFAALCAAADMAVAFLMVHNHSFKQGELAFLYLGAFVALLLAGAGKFSVDGKGGGKSAGPKRPKPSGD